jgi:hypothetical protein
LPDVASQLQVRKKFVTPETRKKLIEGGGPWAPRVIAARATLLGGRAFRLSSFERFRPSGPLTHAHLVVVRGMRFQIML